MTTVTVAATQTFCSWNEAETLDRVEALVRQAAGRGAQIVLPQELFAAPYFCRDELQTHFALAQPIDGHPVVERFRRLAAELQVAMPVSVFERANNAYYNSIAMVDADGSVLGVYRKSHIPDGPGYEEKYYFNPGDTGFKVWQHPLRHGRLRHLLGPVVPGDGALHGAAGRRGAAVPDRDRQRAAGSRRWTARRTGPG